VHLSLWQNGQNVFMASDGSSKYGISTLGKEFMAGVLYNLPSILPFVATLPIRFLLNSFIHICYFDVL
jgi:glutamine synthetase